MLNKQALLSLAGSLLGAFILGLFLLHSHSLSGIKSADAQTCTPPATATNVLVEFPGCNGTQCDLTQASCKWDAQSDAASYNVTVTEVETSTIIKNNESETAGTTKIVFPITQGKTYKCDVVAVSSCGGLATAASDSLLCQADALINTPTPTVAAAPTATPIPPTATPTPTLVPGGIVQTTALVGGILLAIIGGIVLLVL